MDGRFDVTRNNSKFGEITVSHKGLLLEMTYIGDVPSDGRVYRVAALCNGQYVLLGVPAPGKDGKFTLKKAFSKAALENIGFENPEGYTLVLPDEKMDKSEDNVQSPPVKEESLKDKLPIYETTPAETGEAKEEEKPLPIHPPAQKIDQASILTPVEEGPAEQEPVLISNEKEYFTDWRPVENAAVLFSENGAISAADDIKGALVKEEGEIIYLAVPFSENEPFPLMSAFCLGEWEQIGGSEFLVFKIRNGAFSA